MSENGEEYVYAPPPRPAPKPQPDGDRAVLLLREARTLLLSDPSSEVRRRVASWLFDEFVRGPMPF